MLGLQVIYLLLVLVQFLKAAPQRLYLVNFGGYIIHSAQYLPATFGPQTTEHSDFHGHLLAVRPTDACKNITTVAPNNATWFGLLKWSERNKNCTFIEKVLAVQRAAYKAAIVYNDDGEDLITMDGQGNVSIMSVFIGWSDGQFLARYNGSEKYDVYLSADVQNDYMKVMLVVVTALLGAFTGATLVFVTLKVYRVCIRRYREGRLSRRLLRRIPVHRFSSADDPYETCAICLEDFVDRDILRVLPCRHAYHKKCIDPWLLQQHRTCPVCKQRVAPSSEATPLLADQHAPGVTIGPSQLQGHSNTSQLQGHSNPAWSDDEEAHTVDMSNDEDSDLVI